MPQRQTFCKRVNHENPREVKTDSKLSATFRRKTIHPLQDPLEILRKLAKSFSEFHACFNRRIEAVKESKTGGKFRVEGSFRYIMIVINDLVNDGSQDWPMSVMSGFLGAGPWLTLLDALGSRARGPHRKNVARRWTCS